MILHFSFRVSDKLEDYLRTSQQDNQAQQRTIQNLNQDKLNLQTQITQLTQAQTEQTRVNNEQVETIANLNNQLARQREALQQLLNNRKELQKPLQLTKFQGWLEQNKTRDSVRDAKLINWSQTFINVNRNGFEFYREKRNTYASLVSVIEDWLAAEQKTQIQSELTLLREILSHE